MMWKLKVNNVMKFIKRLFKNWFDKICYHDISEIAEFYSPFWYRWYNVKVDKCYKSLCNIRLIYFNEKRDYVEIPNKSAYYYLRKKEKDWFRNIKFKWFGWFIVWKFMRKHFSDVSSIFVFCNNYIYIHNDKFNVDLNILHVCGDTLQELLYELNREIKRLNNLGLRPVTICKNDR